jgi:hypothetical protein
MQILWICWSTLVLATLTYLKLQSMFLTAVIFQFGITLGHQRVSLHCCVWNERTMQPFLCFESWYNLSNNFQRMNTACRQMQANGLFVKQRGNRIVILVYGNTVGQMLLTVNHSPQVPPTCWLLHSGPSGFMSTHRQISTVYFPW